MSDFHRFPSIPYLLSQDVPVRQDKVLTPQERLAFLAHPLYVEEKVDGENLGISFDGGRLLYQARGSYVVPGGAHFRGLESWVKPRAPRLAEFLGTDLILFGEWCAVTHSVFYDSLPDWFMVFDVYQKSSARFWEASRRDHLAHELGLFVVPFLASRHFDEEGLLSLVGQSRLGDQPMEGLVARVDPPTDAPERAKVVRPDFTQSIDRHWRSSPRLRNHLRAPRKRR